MTFDFPLKGHDAQRGECGELLKWVAAPSAAAVDRFLADHDLKRWLGAEPQAMPSHSDERDVAAVLDAEGHVVETAGTHRCWLPGFDLAREWREAVCLAAVRRQPKAAAALLSQLIDLIDATGGLTTNADGTEVPAVDDWPDLAVVYADACRLAQVSPLRSEEAPDA